MLIGKDIQDAFQYCRQPARISRKTCLEADAGTAAGIDILIGCRSLPAQNKIGVGEDKVCIKPAVDFLMPGGKGAGKEGAAWN